MFNGKMKAITFSFDDAVLQDVRMVELMNKYNLKGTFNLNSELLGTGNFLTINSQCIAHYKLRSDDIKAVYEGHEVAAHTLTHPSLKKVDDAEVIRQVEEDRKKLSDLVGYEVVGFAYPGGGRNFDERVTELIRRNTGVKYARATYSTYNFDLPKDLYTFDRLIRDGRKNLFETVVRFAPSEQQLTVPADSRNPEQWKALEGRTLADVEEEAFWNILQDHTDAGVSVISMDCGALSAGSLGELFYFLELACGISAYILGINPFEPAAIRTCGE
jgi:peptidoglycan/xylan/chitin deacetylase (PgdA/CDA1 family)